MSKSYKTFSDWLNDQSESVQKRMEMISGALAWDQALLHSEHVKQLEASHRIKMENEQAPVNAQLLAALKDLFSDYKKLADSGDAGFWSLEDFPVGKQAMAAIAAAEAEQHTKITTTGDKEMSNENAPDFKREIRYDVTKLKTGQKIDCLVIEKDWPEYEIVWAMIEARMTGKQPPASEPVAYAVFTDQGNVLIWSEKPGEYVKAVAEKHGKQITPLYTTPQPAVPDGWVKLAEDLISYQDLVNRIGSSCEFEGQGMIYASCLDEWADQARAMLAAVKDQP